MFVVVTLELLPPPYALPIVPPFKLTNTLPLGIPAASLPPKTFPILPLLILTVMFPSTYGVYVVLPFPPPKTEPSIRPLSTFTCVVYDETVVVLDVPLTVPYALPP